YLRQTVFACGRTGLPCVHRRLATLRDRTALGRFLRASADPAGGVCPDSCPDPVSIVVRPSARRAGDLQSKVRLLVVRSGSIRVDKEPHRFFGRREPLSERTLCELAGSSSGG